MIPIRVVVIDDLPDDCIGEFSMLRQKFCEMVDISERYMIGERDVFMKAYLTDKENVKEDLSASTNSPVAFYIVNYRLYAADEDIRRLIVNQADILLFDICMGDLHGKETQQEAKTKRFTCGGKNDCSCGLNEAICLVGRRDELEEQGITVYHRDDLYLQPEKVSILSSNAKQQQRITDSITGRPDGIQGYLKVNNHHIKKLAARIWSLLQQKEAVEAGLKRNDFAFELAQTWNMGGPCFISHGFSGVTTRPDGNSFTTYKQKCRQAWIDAIADCADRFGKVINWLEDRKIDADALWESQKKWFKEKVERLNAIISSMENCTLEEKAQFCNWFTKQMGEENWALNNRNDIKNSSYRLEILASSSDGDTTNGKALCGVIKDKLEDSKQIEFKWNKRKPTCEVFLPKESFLNLFNELITDLKMKLTEGGKVHLDAWEYIPASEDSSRLRKIVFAFKWQYPPSSLWGNREHPFLSQALNPFYEEKWLQCIYDLWLLSVTDEGLRIWNACDILKSEKGESSGDDVRGGKDYNDAPIITFENRFKAEDRNLGEGESEFQHCLVFRISSCGKP